MQWTYRVIDLYALDMFSFFTHLPVNPDGNIDFMTSFGLISLGISLEMPRFVRTSHLLFNYDSLRKPVCDAIACFFSLCIQYQSVSGHFPFPSWRVHNV